MKIAIISDIHSNLAALEAFPEKAYDQLWCIGDLVDYGPKPHETIQRIQKDATLVVRGNHDHAVGFDVSPQCSAPFTRLAADTRSFTQETCTDEDIAYLRNIPIQRSVKLDSTSFYLVHGVPTDPLFGYCPEHSDQWEKEVNWAHADVLVVGHTHTPFIRTIGSTTVVNPGSLGQPKTGRQLACYAIWEDGELSLREYRYPLADTIEDIRQMPIPQGTRDGLIAVLEAGGLPSAATKLREGARG